MGLDKYARASVIWMLLVAVALALIHLASLGRLTRR